MLRTGSAQPFRLLRAPLLPGAHTGISRRLSPSVTASSSTKRIQSAKTIRLVHTDLFKAWLEEETSGWAEAEEEERKIAACLSKVSRLIAENKGPEALQKSVALAETTAVGDRIEIWEAVRSSASCAKDRDWEKNAEGLLRSLRSS